MLKKRRKCCSRLRWVCHGLPAAASVEGVCGAVGCRFDLSLPKGVCQLVAGRPHEVHGLGRGGGHSGRPRGCRCPSPQKGKRNYHKEITRFDGMRRTHRDGRFARPGSRFGLLSRLHLMGECPPGFVYGGARADKSFIAEPAQHLGERLFLARPTSPLSLAAMEPRTAAAHVRPPLRTAAASTLLVACVCGLWWCFGVVHVL